MNYFNTLVQVAEDCPSDVARAPVARGGRRSKAVIEYDLIAANPYRYTAEDVAFETLAELHDIPEPERAAKRRELVEKGHPRLRVSALTKQYGWGIHSDAEGRVALVAVESPEYRRLQNDPDTTKVRAFRSRRA